MPDAPRPVYGIIGYPVAQSLSPAMHNAAFKELGVDAIYKLFPLKEEDLDGFFGELHDPSSPIGGLNVTTPYKEKAVSYLDSMTPLTQRILAVNTIVITRERRLVGYNTDAPGFLSHLVDLGFNTRDKKIAVLGAGGSARAILGVLCMIPERPESIKIYNRSRERLNALVSDLATRMDTGIIEPAMSIDDLDIPGADLLINTTSVGLRGDDPCLIDEGLLHPSLLVYDLIYNPAETEFLKMARRRGARAANGLGMLYYQGVLALQHWVNIQLDDRIKRVMRQALEEGLHS